MARLTAVAWRAALLVTGTALLLGYAVLVRHDPWTAALPGVAALVVAVVVGPVVHRWVQARWAERLLGEDVVEGSVRAPAGAWGIGPAWRVGRLELSPGRIVFTPLGGGLRFLKAGPIPLDVDAVATTDRRTRLGLRVAGGLHVLEARTSRGLVEIAVDPRASAELVRRVAL